MLLSPSQAAFPRKFGPSSSRSSANTYENFGSWIKRMSVLVVGTVAFDSIETPFGSAERILGGSASFFALGASLFAGVRVVGVVGKDFPQDYLDLFSERDIDIAGIKQESGDTFHWRGRYHEDIN